MGSSASQLREAGRQAAKRRLPPAPTPDEAAVLSKIAAQEQQRMRELPTSEDLATKDMPLDQLLSRISNAIQPHRVDVTQPGAAAVAASTRGSTGSQQAQQQGPPQPVPPPHRSGPHSQGGTAVVLSAKDRLPIPLYTPSGLSPEELAQRQGKPKAAPRNPDAANDDDPGRVQAYVLRQVLEAKNMAAAQGSQLDLTQFVQEHGADPAKIEQLFKHCAIPVMARIKTIGHEYAFARPPPWWLPASATKAMYKSEAAVLGEASTPGASQLPPAFQRRRVEVNAGTQATGTQVAQKQKQKQAPRDAAPAPAPAGVVE